MQVPKPQWDNPCTPLCNVETLVGRTIMPVLAFLIWALAAAANAQHERELYSWWVWVVVNEPQIHRIYTSDQNTPASSDRVKHQLSIGCEEQRLSTYISVVDYRTLLFDGMNVEYVLDDGDAHTLRWNKATDSYSLILEGNDAYSFVLQLVDHEYLHVNVADMSKDGQQYRFQLRGINDLLPLALKSCGYQ